MLCYEFRLLKVLGHLDIPSRCVHQRHLTDKKFSKKEIHGLHINILSALLLTRWKWSIRQWQPLIIVKQGREDEWSCVGLSECFAHGSQQLSGFVEKWVMCLREAAVHLQLLTIWFLYFIKHAWNTKSIKTENTPRRRECFNLDSPTNK